MQTSPYDFVSALSAEELCPVCQELHAAVDECLCSSCQTHVCSDCSSLQPDTSWICTPCAALQPARAYPVATAPSAQQLSRILLTVREQTASLRQQLAPTVQRVSTLRLDQGRVLRMYQHARATLWAAVSALYAWVLATSPRLRSALRTGQVELTRRYQQSLAWARPRMLQLRTRSRELSQRALTQLEWQYRLQSVRARRAVVSGVRLVRTFPVRLHASSLLIAMVILLAVARSQPGTER